MSASFNIRVYVFAMCGVALLGVTRLRAQSNVDFTPYLIADRAAEVALARSAAPRGVSDAATVLVLTRAGFVEAHHGTNGFTCAVFRSFDGSTSDATFWSPAVRAPICLNPAASRTMLSRIMTRTAWLMANVSTRDVDTRTRRAFDTHDFAMPAAGAMAYMLSPRQYLSPDEPHRWMPHLMFFYDKSMPASTWGAGDGKSPVIDGTPNDPSTPIRTILIPVQQWSDGTPATGK